MTRFVKGWLGAAVTTATLALGGGQAFAQKELVFGLQCDRTGPTANVGTVLCPGYQDYIALVNSKGGVEGYKIKVLEIDNEYKVPPAIEAHERFKKEGAVLEGLYGTPQTAALNKKLEEDKILGTSPGFGTSPAADGKRFPYTFPIAASYWSQGGAAVAFAKEKLGDLKGKKIAYLFYDNPAGKEPLPILEDLAKAEGFELRTFAVPAPGLEMGAQILDITGRYKPDFIITHLFGRAPSVSIKELKGKGFPLSKVVAFVWGSSEADIIAAGGMGMAEGYSTIQFAGVGKEFPVIKDIEAMYKAQGKTPPKEMEFDRPVQPRCADRGSACRGGAQRHQGQGGRGAHLRGGQEGHGGDQGLHPGRPRATDGDHDGRPRGRRLGAGLDGQGRQAREGEGLVPGQSPADPEAPRGRRREVLSA